MSVIQLPAHIRERLCRHDKDVITPLVEKRDALIKNLPCSRCGTPLEVKPSSLPLSDGDLIPRAVAHCPSCNYQVDPKTGLVISTGDSVDGVVGPDHIA